MENWLLTSIVLSLGLTLALNLLPRLFPKATRNAENKLHERMEQAFEQSASGNGRSQPNEPAGSGVKIFFPWKTMLIGSIALTALLNLGAVLFR